MSPRVLLLGGCAALIAVPAGAAVGDFRLPTSTPTPTPTVVGPLDPDRPVPRPSPTPTPTPRATATPSPSLTLPAVAPSARATPGSRAAQRPAAAPSPAGTPQADVSPAPVPPAGTLVATPSAPVAPRSAAPVVEADEGPAWPWLAGFALLAALLAAGWIWLRRRMAPGGTVLIVPEIEKPRVPPPQPEPEAERVPEAAEPAAAPALPSHPLHIAIAPLKLTQTVMNATLAYRLSLTNKGEAPLEDLAIAADLVTAHASLPREALLAGPDTELARIHALPALDPGETVEFEGSLRLPLADANPIRQGRAVVFVPLARFRASAGGTEPRCFTLAVGQPSPRGAIQPVRLDLGPRTTEGLAGRAF